MGEGLKRAFKAARLTRQCPVKGCRRIKLPNGSICREHQRQWDEASAKLMKPADHHPMRPASEK